MRVMLGVATAQPVCSAMVRNASSTWTLTLNLPQANPQNPARFLDNEPAAVLSHPRAGLRRRAGDPNDVKLLLQKTLCLAPFSRFCLGRGIQEQDVRFSGSV